MNYDEQNLATTALVAAGLCGEDTFFAGTLESARVVGLTVYVPNVTPTTTPTPDVVE